MQFTAETVTWRARSGPVRITDMSDRHLQNAILYLEAFGVEAKDPNNVESPCSQLDFEADEIQDVIAGEIQDAGERMQSLLTPESLSKILEASLSASSENTPVALVKSVYDEQVKSFVLHVMKQELARRPVSDDIHSGDDLEAARIRAASQRTAYFRRNPQKCPSTK